MYDAEHVSALLQQLNAGHDSVAEELFPLIYADLRAMARRQLRGRNHTLQATALVNEVYLRLAAQPGAGPIDRERFLGLAARVMRQVLIDHIRGKQRAKRGGGWERVALDEAVLGSRSQGVDLLALEDALSRLGEIHPERVRLAELRYFGGLTLEETSSVLGISVATAKREWAATRVWLFRELTGERPDDE
jgi:RNA polymerase sigma factor (TIGR02999 family)